MKVEYLHDGSPDCPLIRIYGVSADEFRELRSRLLQIASGQQDTLDVTAMPGFEALGGISLMLITGPNDQPLTKHKERFEWRLTRDRCDDLAGLVEPLTQPASSGYQWLCGGRSASFPSTVAVVLSRSPGGSW